MKLGIVISLVCLVLAMADTAGAKLYKYYDQSGNLCVTDDLSQVPESMRPSTETLEEISTSSSPSHPASTDQAPESSRPQQTDMKLESSLRVEFVRLETLRKDLEARYAVLKQRREDLLLEQKEEKSPQGLEEFNQKILDLNRDTIGYKKKKERYLKQVDAYNKKLESK